MKSIFRKKDKNKCETIMIHKKVIDLDTRYMIVDYYTHKRKVIMQRNIKNEK